MWGAVVVVIEWQLELQLLVQSVPKIKLITVFQKENANGLIWLFYLISILDDIRVA